MKFKKLLSTGFIKISTCAKCTFYNYGKCTIEDKYVQVLEKIPEWCPLPEWGAD